MGSAGAAHILLIGGGRMGGALAEGWLKSDPTLQITVIDPNRPPFAEQARVSYLSNAEALHADTPFDGIVLAVKPQYMDDVLASETLQQYAANSWVLSVAAGKTIAYFEETLGPETRIIRVMPNTPALIGQGMSALCASTHATDADRKTAEARMQAVGKTIWLDDESQMDAFTALAGSGPAYLFHLIEAMAIAGEKAGLPKETAMQAARQTVIGAAALAESSDQSAASLREQVTSPGGTTEAALKILMGTEGLSALMTSAIEAAASRAKEL